ncbi:UDP-N-acetylmuramoyl-L-alanyl-D-glutamate--2,6-diaminopimelate ligase [Corynebacterium alimapuense]|uniref:UDP-N-acetylmuramoyl-L-alanyl-D-glutamate--2,6-diaminopimelate ligase n=1 Tax=Corynebacterium alimapuense TaxID=1576874 RepID=A0A3M8K8F0_9CORY|nr:UDP-N-acetylmuramoyl-L-alanyl-D-glutamate--2,6-diaminopimelate ligase [Corynebacterium alimapuense]RNE49491.1 UDP-N-acetylmuramoyl-L-alanyl-D-glutamate--2,6-diaminopimelate ligase [Corynebacterium alimapuense]
MNQQSPTLSKLAHLSGGELLHTDGHDPVITSIGLDSASLEVGALFAAVPGTRKHGAEFAAATAAAAILTDRAGRELLEAADEKRPVLVVEDVRSVLGEISAEIYGHPSQDLTLIGVTGTSGKTTTSYLLEVGLMAAGYHVGLIGTTGTRINGRSVPTKLTTPEAPTLQALFARMRTEGVTHVVMEVSSHALSLGRVDGTNFDVAGFTNLSQDHLDFHPTMEDYFEAKAKFFDPKFSVAAGHSVICVDDIWGQQMATRAANPVTVSTTGVPSDVSARQIELAPSGAQTVELDLPDRDEPLRFVLPLPGDFNIANAALATALAWSVDVPTERFVAGLSKVAVPGRMERIDAGQDFLAVVDYAHKPAAVAAVLDTLKDQISGRLGVIIGAGGDRDPGKRPIMGAEAARRADLVIITDDNPRSEVPETIRAAVLAGAKKAATDAEILEIGDRAAAIEALVAWAKPGDGIIVAGKGHEVGQLIAGVDHHFDDREQLRRALDDRILKEGEQ